MATPTYRIRGTRRWKDDVELPSKLGVTIEPAAKPPAAITGLREAASPSGRSLDEILRHAQQVLDETADTQLRLMPRPTIGAGKAPSHIGGFLHAVGSSIAAQPAVRAAMSPLGQAMLGEMIPFGAILSRLRGVPAAATAEAMLPAGTAGAAPRIRSEVAAFSRGVRPRTPAPALPPTHYLEAAQRAPALEGLQHAAATPAPELSSLRGAGRMSPDVSRYSEGLRSEALSPEIEDLFIDDIPMREFLTKDYSELIRR